MANRAAGGDVVGVTGRVSSVPNTGKLCFATVVEGAGTELRAMLGPNNVGPPTCFWPGTRQSTWKRAFRTGMRALAHANALRADLSPRRRHAVPEPPYRIPWFAMPSGCLRGAFGVSE
ncbi:hypothetical protein GCM10027436_81030 [Actinophytocola sediminis]